MSAFYLTWFLSRYILSGVACSPMRMEKNGVKVAARRRPAICDKFQHTIAGQTRRSVFSESVEMFAMLQVDTPSEQLIVALVRGHMKAKDERLGEGMKWIEIESCMIDHAEHKWLLVSTLPWSD
ncbi:hypothetical protein EV424DRAFT_1346783 [Suillus variegatus]|nr:hypothetical protein EV424DRAFT_1346783 [Suillus variegatus]